MHILDDPASRLTTAGGDLSRRALEALAAEEFPDRTDTRVTCTHWHVILKAHNECV